MTTNETKQDDFQREEMKQEMMQTNENLQEDNPQNDKIHGWLSFFLIIVGIGGVASFFMPLMSVDENVFKISPLFGATDIVFGTLLLCMAIYTIYAFNKRLPNAPTIGRWYIVICFLSNVITIYMGGTEEEGFYSLSRVVGAMCWNVFWVLYLTFAPQVKTLFPPKERSLFKRDYVIIGCTIVIPLIMGTVGYNQLLRAVNMPEEMPITERYVLQENEITDGRIIFTIPEGFVCKQMDNPDIIMYQMDNDVEAPSITYMLFSANDFDNSDIEFGKYVTAFVNSMSTIASSVIDEKHFRLNGSFCRTKTLLLTDDDIRMICEVATLYNPDTQNTCASICYYSENEESPTRDLLETVRF